MSLKAKLEAVIYAAEEPVTLAQLASIFAGDALAWEAERSAAAEEAAGLQTDTGGAKAPGEEAPGDLDSTTELADLVATVEGRVAQQDGETEQGGDAVPAATAAEPGGDSSAEIARAARKREREVREILRKVLDELIADYADGRRGIEIREIAGGFRMGTKPEIHDAVRMFVRSLKPPMKLSLPALETLAVIAYKQPVTAPEVGEIRGVDSAGVLGSLMSRKLITTAGRKQVIGRPILYKTTKEFLLQFGLKDVNELPSMEEFEKMAAMELSETEDADAEGERGQTSGDLFADVEAQGGDVEGLEEVEMRGSGEHEAEPEAVSIPTAEPLQEAAAAHALVERLNAEEVEAESEKAGIAE